jgi:hypothetical protein
MDIRFRRREAMLGALGLAAAAPAAAQARWEPNRPVQFIVPAGTGGGADQMARAIQGIVSKHNLMRQPIVVVNKAGGAGAEGFLEARGARGNPHLLIITLSFVPVFALQAQEGRLFSPLAYTKTFILLVDAFLAVTLTPVLIYYFLGKRGKRKTNAPLNRNPQTFLNRWLEPVVGATQVHLDLSSTKLAFELITSTVMALLGISVAYAVYLKQKVDPRRIELPLFANGWYIDSAITNFMGGLGRKGFELIALFDKVVIDGAVNGVARATRGGALRLRTVQSGYVRWYALMIGVGAVLIVAFVLTQVSF